MSHSPAAVLVLALLLMASPSGASDVPKPPPPAWSESVPFCHVPAAYSLIVSETAETAGIPAWILARVIAAESSWRPDPPRRPRDDGSVDLGIAQFNSAFMADFIWFDNGGRVFDPLNPRQAIPVAARYLARLYRALGSWPLALAAYNCGPGRVRRGDIPAQTRAYVAKVLLP